MDRVKINIPESNNEFSYEFKVQIGDLNYGDHVGNDKILLYCHEARQRYLHSLNQSELSFLNNSLIMSDSTCVYKSQARWNDSLKVIVTAANFKETSFRFYYKIINTQTLKDVAHIQTTMVLFDYRENKVVRLADVGLLIKLFSDRS